MSDLIKYHRTGFICCGTMAVFIQPVPAKNPQKAPNIIVILADDMGFSDLGCYGSEILTPNIDSLANNGIRFANFYNGARSCPSRASLLTGLYAHKAGMGDMVYSGMNKKGLPAYQNHLSNNTITIAELLKQKDYHTFMSGKWHLGDSLPNWPANRGFDRYFGLISGASNYFDISTPANAGTKRVLATGNTEIESTPEGFYITKAITDSAINMINSVRDEKPFFLYLSYTAPHWPLQAEAEDIAKFKGFYDNGWDEIRHKRLEKLNTTGLFSEKLVLSERNETVPEWNICADKPTAIRKMEVYAAMIYRMDAEIGKLLRELKSKGLDKNTIIFFMSDNGACEEHGTFGFDRMKNNSEIGTEKSFVSYGASWANVCNTPFRYFKEKTYEGGIRNPAIVYWPALANRKSSVVEKQTHLMDILPTITEITGAKYPDKYNGHNIPKMDGISFLADLKGQNGKKHRFLAWEHEGNKAIIMGDFKCVKHRNGNWEMYNLKNDKTETINIIENNKKRFNKMMGMYANWEKSNGVVEFE